jgi:hypothetical protein
MGRAPARMLADVVAASTSPSDLDPPVPLGAR